MPIVFLGAVGQGFAQVVVSQHSNVGRVATSWRQGQCHQLAFSNSIQVQRSAAPHSECHWVISNDYQKVPIHTFLQNLSVD